jgi:hypothetical protein
VAAWRASTSCRAVRSASCRRARSRAWAHWAANAARNPASTSSPAPVSSRGRERASTVPSPPSGIATQGTPPADPCCARPAARAAPTSVSAGDASPGAAPGSSSAASATPGSARAWRTTSVTTSARVRAVASRSPVALSRRSSSSARWRSVTSIAMPMNRSGSPSPSRYTRPRAFSHRGPRPGWTTRNSSSHVPAVRTASAMRDSTRSRSRGSTVASHSRGSPPAVAGRPTRSAYSPDQRTRSDGRCQSQTPERPARCASARLSSIPRRVASRCSRALSSNSSTNSVTLDRRITGSTGFSR